MDPQKRTNPVLHRIIQGLFKCVLICGEWAAPPAAPRCPRGKEHQGAQAFVAAISFDKWRCWGQEYPGGCMHLEKQKAMGYPWYTEASLGVAGRLLGQLYHQANRTKHPRRNWKTYSKMVVPQFPTSNTIPCSNMSNHRTSRNIIDSWCLWISKTNPDVSTRTCNSLVCTEPKLLSDSNFWRLTLLQMILIYEYPLNQ